MPEGLTIEDQEYTESQQGQTPVATNNNWSSIPLFVPKHALG